MQHLTTLPILLLASIMTPGSEKLQSFNGFKSKYPEGSAKQAHVALEHLHPA